MFESLTLEQKAFAKSFLETHNQYDVTVENLLNYLKGNSSEYFEGYTQVADAHNLWRDAISFANPEKLETPEVHTYKVTVAQVIYQSATFDIQASSQDEAEQFAKNRAWDSTEFKTVDSEQFVNNCEVVK